MELFLILLGCAVVWVAVETAKEMLADAEDRRDDRIMARYLAEEERRGHIRRLASIDATVQATLDELDRIAAEARGEIIEGSCREIEVKR
jgi:chloramphenicol 3-O-phosphotransferase